MFVSGIILVSKAQGKLTNALHKILDLAENDCQGQTKAITGTFSDKKKTVTFLIDTGLNHLRQCRLMPVSCSLPHLMTIPTVIIK